MSTVFHRFDYAKFLVECHPEEWEGIYGSLCRSTSMRKFAGDWDKSHKVNRLWYNQQQDLETWSIDIWGEWAGVIEVLGASWFPRLRRVDTRAIVWDCEGATIIEIGKQLLSVPTGHNIHVFNSRVASKRMGRDRGGQTVAIGSHKSDLRITLYKRAGDPVAQEFQMQGHYLNRLKQSTLEALEGKTITCSVWEHLRGLVVTAGETRLERVFEAGGIGTYWPVIGPEPSVGEQYRSSAFVAAMAPEEDFPDQEDPSRPA